MNNAGHHRLKACESVLKRFLDYHEFIGRGNKDKQKGFEMLSGVSVNLGEIQKMQELTMSASDLMKNTAKTGVAAAVMCTGVPSLVTGAVSTFAAASTGTAISSLSGAAATNATLAWLGGGSIATGGGGVAAGAAVLSATTWAVTGGVALAAAGLIASTHYSKKLTETTKQYADVQKWAADCSLNRKKLEAVRKRCDELDNVLSQTESIGTDLLDYLEPLIYDFETKNLYYEKLYHHSALIASSIYKQSQVSLIENGSLSKESELIVAETRSLLIKDI